MAGIVDYLTWRGDLTLSERPFNDADNVILSTLSYLDFSDIVPSSGKGRIPLGVAGKALLKDCDGDITKRVRSLAKVDSSFLPKLIASRRFKDMLLHDYADVTDEDRSLQFAALQVDISPEETYVSFRGTDMSLVGWRENFMMSFTVTEAQREAAAYLKEALIKARIVGRRILVGGHSKGGNLALYAALVSPQELRDTIRFVWNNDGPGLAPDIMEEESSGDLGDHYRLIVPSYDMVGIIFQRIEDPTIVTKSNVSGARQHDPFTWKVMPDGVDAADSLSPEGKVMREALNKWLASVPLEQRAMLVDQLFDALEAGGARKLTDVIESAKSLSVVLNAMNNLDESTKELLREFAGIVMSTTVVSAASTAQEVAQSAMQVARDLVGGLVRLADKREVSESDAVVSETLDDGESK